MSVLDLVNAVYKEDLEAIKHLIEEKGIDPNDSYNDTHCDCDYYGEECDCDIDQTTALGKACEDYTGTPMQLDIVNYLLDNGADPNKRGDFNGEYPPLSICLRDISKRKKIAHILVEKGKVDLDTGLGYCHNFTYLLRAISIGNNVSDHYKRGVFLNKSYKTVKFLIELGVGVDAPDKSGMTPLMFAAGYGRYDIVKLLLKNGANINLKDVDGTDALECAMMNGHSKLAKYLVRKGATNPLSKSIENMSEPSIQEKYDLLLNLTRYTNERVKELVENKHVKTFIKT